jgi:hypothetical protein
VFRDPIASALQELAVARKLVSKSGHRQVRRQEDRDSLSAVAYAWFKSHKKEIAARADPTLLKKADDAYRVILDATAKNSAQSTYLDAIADAAALSLVSSSNEAADTSRKRSGLSPLARSGMRTLMAARMPKCSGAGGSASS